MKIKEYIEEIGPYHWRIRKGYTPFMQCEAHFFANETLLEGFLKDKSLEQLVNVTALPGVLEPVYGMPDMHEGYGFPIGGVAAVDLKEGVISPGGIGYDINCGVRLLRTDLFFQDIQNRIPKLTEELFKTIPSGLKRGSGLKMDKKTFQKVMKQGAQAVVELGYGEEEDVLFTESEGCLPEADPKTVSQKAIERGFNQLGTIGSGNHFVEIQRVSKIFQPEIAEAFGLWKGQIVVLIHTGSRGFGHQIATDYIRQMLDQLERWKIYLPDRQLACAPLQSDIGQSYFQAMCCAANFAWANRQVITHRVRKAFEKLFGNTKVEVCYDVAHNIAKIEEHKWQGKRKKMLVHRKGSTRAFPMNHPEVIQAYRSVGHPVLIPGSMGTSSYVLVGIPDNPCFGSTCHGAGRQLSRKKAVSQVNAKELLKELQGQGISAMAGSLRGLAEEAPIAYKDVSLVVETVEKAGIAMRVAKMRPLGVIKG